MLYIVISSKICDEIVFFKSEGSNNLSPVKKSYQHLSSKRRHTSNCPIIVCDNNFAMKIIAILLLSPAQPSVN